MKRHEKISELGDIHQLELKAFKTGMTKLITLESDKAIN
jgi:hypothetical protein